jgi:signal transduction histidine kinase
MVASTKPLSSGQVEEIQRTAQQAGKVLASIGMRGAQEEVASKLSWREAADSLVAVTHFARALAHDLNNALSVVIGEGHLLMDELERLTELESAQGGLQCAEAQETKKPEVRAAEDSAGQKKLQSGDADEEVVAGDARAKETLAVCRGRVRTIMERAHRLAGMARALEEYAAPRPVEPLEQVDLTVLAHEAVDITSCVWEAEGQARGCSVELRCESEGPVLVYGVPAQLRRALVHLVFNAIQAIESGSGTIVVRVYNDASEAVCEVEDTGVGMTPEVLRRAREPFFTTRPGVCKGLGLSLADAIVRQHGGEMSMDTQPGRGTRVTIYLPGV